jgi:hypothetical protein
MMSTLAAVISPGVEHQDGSQPLTGRPCAPQGGGSDRPTSAEARLVARRLLGARRFDGKVPAVDGRPWLEHAAEAREKPGKSAVSLPAHERARHVGPARVFEPDEEAFAAVQAGRVKPGGVVVIRHEGPRGGGHEPPPNRPGCHVRIGSRGASRDHSRTGSSTRHAPPLQTS